MFLTRFRLGFVEKGASLSLLGCASDRDVHFRISIPAEPVLVLNRFRF